MLHDDAVGVSVCVCVCVCDGCVRNMTNWMVVEGRAGGLGGGGAVGFGKRLGLEWLGVEVQSRREGVDGTGVL